MILMMRSMVSVMILGRPSTRSTATKSSLYTSAGELAISLMPASSMSLVAATEKIWTPASLALSTMALMPPQGLPVTWPSLMTTEKCTAPGLA